MTAMGCAIHLEATASVMGLIRRVSPDPAITVLLTSTVLSGPATANTYARGSMAMWVTNPPCAERTTTGPIGQIDYMHAESTAASIMEVRRRSGLTWEELGDLFKVSRRSVHHWANGKPVSARHERMIRRMLAAVRHLDRGDAAGTRAVLLAVDEDISVSRFDLLRDGRFDEAVGSIKDVPEFERQRIPLASTAWDVRWPQMPISLLGAEQDRPEIPAKARVARPKRTPKRTG